MLIVRFSYLHEFSEHLGQNWGFLEGSKKRGGAISTPNELVLTFGGLPLCDQFGENRQRNATVRVSTHGQTDRRTQTNCIICPLLYAIAMEQINTYKL